MQYSSSPSPIPPPSDVARHDTDSLARGLLRGLLPLALVTGVVALLLLLELLVGHATQGQDFFTQQRAALIVLIAGALGAVATYIVSCSMSLRQVARWQSERFPATARGALIGLTITALVILVPVLLAFVVPQHPAP